MLKHFVHKISLMIHTASYDNFLECQGIPSYFKALLDNLQRQTIHQFELVYVDTFYEQNKERFDSYLPGLKFIVKHVPIHDEHRYWFDKGYTYISSAKNTGILYADGELCITCDDAEFFPEDILARYWKHYKTGHYMLGMYDRMKTIVTKNGLPSYPLRGEIYRNDTRFRHLAGKNLLHHTTGDWAYAGTSFSLNDALELNGFNERMDGCKSLEDCDFGNRLRILGRKFVLDIHGVFYIVDHPNYSDMTPVNWEIGEGGQKVEIKNELVKKKIENLVAIENYGMYKCAHELYEYKANCNPLTKKHLEIIKRETLHYRKFDPFSAENAEKFEIWKNVPTFDLRSQRENLRKSSDWRW